MPEKKKQHYVSQFLLRNFSIPDNPKLINLHNLSQGKTVGSTAIKNQAQESFYYGRDLTFENFLGHTEKKVSHLIKSIIDKQELPKYRDKAYAGLLHFIMLYSFRTKANVDKTENGINEAIKKLSKYVKELENIDFEKYRIKHPEPAAYNLASYMDNWVITYDLNSVLLINKTDKPFIISDNPLVQYNPFMLKRELYEIAGGLINKGLILFFPLSPKYCFMMYDSSAYETNESERKIEISKDLDIYNLNTLQAIGVNENIFFSEITYSDYVTEIVQKGSMYGVKKHINEVLKHPTDPSKIQFITYYVEHRTVLNLSFLWENPLNINVSDIKELSTPRNKEIEDWVKMDKSKLWRNNKID
jgi:hypothetical protein